jgi:hypothetical protein
MTDVDTVYAIRVIGHNRAFDGPHVLAIVESGGNPAEGTISRQDAEALMSAREALPIRDE